MLAEKSKKWREANKDEIAERSKKWREENKDEIREKKKEYRENNLEKVKAANRAYYEANKEEIYRKSKEYKEANREETNKYFREYNKERRKTDPVFAIHCNLRSRLKQCIRKESKTGSAVRDMGCTGKEIKRHLESLFDENMTWGNYGEYWHIDHIYPLAAANLDDRAEFLAVNNWRNLQPLEAIANLKKNDKVTPEARRLFNKLKKEFSKKKAG